MTHTPPIHHHLSPLGEKRKEKKKKRFKVGPIPTVYIHIILIMSVMIHQITA
jgi:hypothetical protein